MIEDLINQVDSIILTFVQGSFGNLTSTITTLWRLMFIVFIAFYGYKVIISGRFLGSDLILHCVKIIVLLVLATEWDTFFIFVYKMVTDLPSDIAGLIMSGAAGSFGDPAATDTASANTALTNFYDRSIEVSDKIMEGAGWSDFGLYFYAGAIWIGAIGFTGYATMLIVLAKVAVAILLAVGPVFILLLIFNNTKNLFEGWLRSLLNYAVIPIFVYALLALLLTLAEAPLKFMEDNSGPNSELMTPVAPFMLMSFVGTVLLAQIMNMAASVTGGLSLSTMGSFARSLSSARKAPATIGRISRSAGKNSYIAYRAVKNPKQTFEAAKSSLNQTLKNVREFKK